MKKFTLMLTLLLTLCIGQVNAQRGWESDLVNVAEIVPGEDHYYVLQQGFGKPTVALGLFLNTGSGEMVPNIDGSCIFNFIEVSKKEVDGETFPVYMLKNLENGQYLSNTRGVYTSSPIEAFQFTARKARAVNPKDKTQYDKTNWYSYSDAVNETTNAGAAENGNWIFCSPDAFKFISFDGNPGFSNVYIVSTNWRVYAAKEKELSAREKFLTTYDRYFGTTDIAANYQVGTNPGCISQAMFDELAAVKAEADEATSNTELSDAEYDRINQAIQDIFVKAENNVIPLTPGYFVIENLREGFLNAAVSGYCDHTKELPAAWNMDNAIYIWQVETADEGNFYLKHLQSKKYLSNKNNAFHMVDVARFKYAATHHHGDCFILNDGSGNLHSKQTSGELTYWNNIETDASQWRFFAVDSKIVDSLNVYIQQNYLNGRLAKATHNAQVTLNGLQTESGLTMDGTYAPNAAGLVSSFVQCNATDASITNPERAAFDRNVRTFYHSMWNSSAPADTRHWCEVDFGQLVQDIYIKMTRRVDSPSANPTRIALMAPAEDNVELPSWDDIVYEDTVIYTYPTDFVDSIVDSATYIQKIHLNRPVQHARFTATHTIRNKYWNNGGPTWNVCELRFYDVANCVHNPKYDLIPKKYIDAVEQTIAKAKEELADKKATEETLTALSLALDSMWAYYPDPNALKTALENAETRLNSAVESEVETPEFWGYYRSGAKATLEKTINDIRTVVNDESKTLTLDEINQYKQQLADALKVFQGQLLLPDDGYYHLVCAPGNSEEGEPYEQEGCMIAVSNADVKEAVAWGYNYDTAPETHWNSIWKLEKNENGVSFRNAMSGLYLDNPYWGLTEEQQDSIGVSRKITSSKTPKYFSLQASPEAGKFVLCMKEERFVNASGQKTNGFVGNALAIWHDYATGNRSRFTFEPVNPADYTDNSLILGCEPEKTLILSHAFDIKNVFTADGNGAYKVLGVKDGFIELKKYETDEIIPAATPFIIFTQPEENEYEVVPVAANPEALLNSEFKYSPVCANGLVSAIETTEMGEGFGLLFQGKVIVSQGGEIVLGGSGFFNNELKTTTEVGDQHIELKDAITGEGTAIADIVEGAVANDVYTISGVKVRHNVKGAAATQGLPKGIYIVGGQKVIVK